MSWPTSSGDGREGGGPEEVSIAIVGAGFSGLGMAMRLKASGIEDFVLLDRSDEIGGTWRDNTYPGCACDVPSPLYSYSFAPNPSWSRVYARQPEILDYLRSCAAGNGLAPHLRLGEELLSASWDEEQAAWSIETDRGRLRSRILIGAMGPLGEPRLPALPGIESFCGPAFHSAAWNHDEDLAGKRVAVIGTGASAVQLIPHLERTARRVVVFQRTPAWVLPQPDYKTEPLERRLYRLVPPLQTAVRGGIYAAGEGLGAGLLGQPHLLRPLERVGRRHLRLQVPDAELRRKLEPSFTIGCKRILFSSTYYPALSRPHVELVTEDVDSVHERSLRTASGRHHEVDALVFATGFAVLSQANFRRVHGRDGRCLAEVWNGFPQAYLGTTTAGFPNFFMLTGPNAGTGHNSLLVMIEAQIAYVLDALRRMRRCKVAAVEVRPPVQAAYNAALQERSANTVWTQGGCRSWYLDSEGRNPTIWPGHTFSYRRRTRRFRFDDYELRPDA